MAEKSGSEAAVYDAATIVDVVRSRAVTREEAIALITEWGAMRFSEGGCATAQEAVSIVASLGANHRQQGIV